MRKGEGAGAGEWVEGWRVEEWRGGGAVGWRGLGVEG